jgi:hypothetical protein
MFCPFKDPAGRDVDAATWYSPHGPLLVCVSDDVGYDLYSPEEWTCCAPPNFKADEDGRVIYHELVTGLVVPAEIRRKAIH